MSPGAYTGIHDSTVSRSLSPAGTRSRRGSDRSSPDDRPADASAGLPKARRRGSAARFEFPARISRSGWSDRPFLIDGCKARRRGHRPRKPGQDSARGRSRGDRGNGRQSTRCPTSTRTRLACRPPTLRFGRGDAAFSRWLVRPCRLRRGSMARARFTSPRRGAIGRSGLPDMHLASIARSSSSIMSRSSCT